MSSIDKLSQENKSALVSYLLELGDDALVLGHRLSEWCAYGPSLEEDLALANIALDTLGHAKAFLELAGKVEGEGRNEDTLAYFREAIEFKNCLMVELPKGDFALTIVRQYLYSEFNLQRMRALSKSKIEELAAIAIKAEKEVSYHLRHSQQWLLRLGDGTDLSNQKAQEALYELWPYSEEFFVPSAAAETLVEANQIPDLTGDRADVAKRVAESIKAAKLQLTKDGPAHIGGRNGRHTEHLGHMLAEMQILARSYPGASW